MSKSIENKKQDDDSKQHDLRYLFFITTCVAVGLALCTQRGFHSGLRTIGLGIVEYWMAKGFFVISKRLPNVLREIVFLFGLPLFVGAMYCVLTGLVALAVDLLPQMSP